jgi:hypothetical protein
MTYPYRGIHGKKLLKMRAKKCAKTRIVEQEDGNTKILIQSFKI